MQDPSAYEMDSHSRPMTPDNPHNTSKVDISRELCGDAAL